RERLQLGLSLGEMMLPGQIRDRFDALRGSLPNATGLRLRLRFKKANGDRRLLRLPWEYALLGTHEKPLALDPRISFVRHPIKSNDPSPRLEFPAEPIRLVYARATDVPNFDRLAEGEGEQLLETAARSPQRIDVHVVEDDTVTALLEALQTTTSIFHFSGHGVV